MPPFWRALLLIGEAYLTVHELILLKINEVF